MFAERTARPGEINYPPFDRYSPLHGLVGVAAGLIGLRILARPVVRNGQHHLLARWLSALGGARRFSGAFRPCGGGRFGRRT